MNEPTETLGNTPATNKDNAVSVTENNAGTATPASAESWDLERPPLFHCRNLMIKINEIVPPENERLMTEREITELDTQTCRETARRLSYVGRVRFQGEFPKYLLHWGS